jgi:hypothetical protein
MLVTDKGTKVCSNPECLMGGVEQDLSKFHRNSAQPDGLQNYCKQCANAANRGSYGLYSERVCHQQREYYRGLGKEEIYRRYRDKHLKLTYGITQEQYIDMVESQDGQCGCCGRLMNLNSAHKTDSPVIHHNHKTNEIVGVWSSRCNMVEGLLVTSDIALSMYLAMKEGEQ